MERPEAEQYLEALGEILEKEADEPVYMLICGGMAGILQDLLHRPTRHIDCAGFVVIEDGVPVLRKPHYWRNPCAAPFDVLQRYIRCHTTG